MTVDEVIERALRMLDTPVLYWIGKGGRFDADDDAAPPGEPIDVEDELAALPPGKRADYLAKAAAAGIDAVPAGRVPACDCSNFSNWVLRIPQGSRDWMFTGAMHADATRTTKVFRRIPAAEPGALLVYPKPPDEEFGHVGIVTAVDGPRIEVVHCSARNFLETRNAIARTGTEDFDRQPGTIVAWCLRVRRP